MTIYQCPMCGWHRSEDPPCPQIIRDVPAWQLPVKAGLSWPEELRVRGIAAGYGNVLIGACDAEGTDAEGFSFCGRPHHEGPQIDRTPALWVIVKAMGLPMASGSCHWCCFFTDEMTKAQRAAVDGRRSWVSERENRFRPGDYGSCGTIRSVG